MPKRTRTVTETSVHSTGELQQVSHELKEKLQSGQSKKQRQKQQLSNKQKLAKGAANKVRSDQRREAKQRNMKKEVLFFELTNFGFVQNKEFVKIFVLLDGVEEVPASNALLTLTTRSVQLRILNFKDSNFLFAVDGLLQLIDVSKSYKEVRQDMVAIYLKKIEEGLVWSHLTAKEKAAALKDEQVKVQK